MDCCRPQEKIHRRDAIIGAGLTIGAALLVAAIMVVGNHPLTESIGLTMTPTVLVVGWMWIQLRGRSWAAKLLFIGGPLVVTFLIGLAGGLAVSNGP